MRPIVCCFTILALGSGGGSEANGAEPFQDVLVFTDTRPVVFRLRIESEGQPLVTRWEEYLAEYFRYLDRNGNGTLDGAEARLLPHARQIRYQVQGLLASFGTTKRVSLNDLDSNRDKKIDPAELRAYYRAHGGGPVQVPTTYVPPGLSDDLSEAIFARLDANADGAVSRTEAEGAAKGLALFDGDDDEILTAAEIQGTPAGVQIRRVSGPVAGRGEHLFVLDRTARTALKQGIPLADAALAHYDRDRDRNLTRSEMALPDATFDGLDANRDGKLDRLELVRLWRLGADVEAVVRVGNPSNRGRHPPERDPPIEVIRSARGVAEVETGGPRTERVLRGSAGRMARPDAPAEVMLPVGEMHFRLSRDTGRPNVSSNYRTYFKQLFGRVDTEGIGHVTRKQVEPRKYRPLQTLFDLADRDGDDRLTEAEIESYLAVNGKAAGTVVTVSFEMTGRGLFAMLDADGDGRLGVREMRAAWSHLKGNDRDRDGKVTREEIPKQYHLGVSRGPATSRQTSRFTPGRPFGGATPAAARTGPVWFSKMDRNRDGDVSVREFLGPREVFARIDEDGDGLIDPKEAGQADAVMRSGK